MSDENAGSKFVAYVILAGVFNNPLWTDEKGAARTLAEARPDLNVQKIGGYCWFNGADQYKTRFVATDQKGKTITACVTQGWIFKGSTIRYEP